MLYQSVKLFSCNTVLDRFKRKNKINKAKILIEAEVVVIERSC